MNTADVARPFCNAPVETTGPEGLDCIDGVSDACGTDDVSDPDDIN
jgi:hypothetical protein